MFLFMGTHCKRVSMGIMHVNLPFFFSVALAACTAWIHPGCVLETVVRIVLLSCLHASLNEHCVRLIRCLNFHLTHAGTEPQRHWLVGFHVISLEASMDLQRGDVLFILFGEVSAVLVIW